MGTECKKMCNFQNVYSTRETHFICFILEINYIKLLYPKQESGLESGSRERLTAVQVSGFW